MQVYLYTHLHTTQTLLQVIKLETLLEILKEKGREVNFLLSRLLGKGFMEQYKMKVHSKNALCALFLNIILF
jgi:hypothetical protein